MSTILLNCPFMLTLIFFFFLVLSPKIACSVQLLYRFQGNENGAWHCGSFMQIVARLAALPGCENAHRQMGVHQGQRDSPGVWITLHPQPFVPDPLSPSCKPDRNRRWIWLSPFYRVEKLRYETTPCLYKGLLAPSVLGLNLQIWLPLDTLLLLLRLQTLPDDSASPLGWFCSDPPSWSWWHAELSAIGQSC